MTDRSTRGSATITRQTWLVTFTDLLALMLAFFVLLFSMSQIKMQTWEAFVEGLTDRLNPKDEWRDPTLLSVRQAERVLHRKAVNLGYLHVLLKEKVTASSVLGEGFISRHDDRLILSLPGDSIFSGRAETMTASAHAAILLLAQSLQFVGNQIDVVGHSTPAKNGQKAIWEKTWTTTLHRALAVAAVLRRSGYVRHVRALGVGDGHYFGLESSLTARQKRRLGNRVDIVIRDIMATGGGDER